MVFDTRRHIRVPVVSEKPLESRMQPLSIVSHFESTIPSCVVINTRSGLSITLPAYMGFNAVPNPVVRIQYEVVYNHGVKINMDDVLNGLSDTVPFEYQVLREAIERGAVQHGRLQNRALITYEFPLSFLEEHNGDPYIPGVDLVISVKSEQDTKPHPYSPVHLRQALLADMALNLAKDSMYVGYLIVDNGDQLGTRYVNINDQVYRIDPARDALRANGLYLLGSQPIEFDHATAGEKLTFIEMEQVLERPHEYGLYPSFSEARFKGDAKTRKLLEDQEAQERAHQRELERFELDQRKRSEEEEYKKAEYERKLAEAARRESLEWLKFIPALVGGVIAMVKILR